MSGTEKLVGQPHHSESHPVCRILVIEDNADEQQLAKLVLGKLGAKVTGEQDGQAGVEQVMNSLTKGEPFDVILVDLKMPKLDGIETVHRLRELGFAGPIIAVTAYDSPDIRDDLTAVGCDRVIAKPYRVAELRKAIASVYPALG